VSFELLPVKRLELILPSAELEIVLEKLDRYGVTKYTIVDNIDGKGDRGSSSDEFGDRGQNVYILIACNTETANLVCQKMTTFLERFGGMCLVTDSSWLVHGSGSI
jgi:nitrogen regulatory protein PII